MIRKTLDGIPYYEFELFQKFRGGLRHAVFTRHSPVDRTDGIQNILETNAKPLSFKNQLHGTDICIVEQNHPLERNGDVLITNCKNIPLMIRIADCASVILYDPAENVIANIHAGWRGLAQKIIHKTIDRLGERFGTKSKNLLATISPMIGPCCCRFSDPYRELPEDLYCYIKVAQPRLGVNQVASLRLGLAEENMVDLWGAVEGHLRECGVLPEHIENPRMCTSCHPEDFFSFRREGDIGRFATAIMLT